MSDGGDRRLEHTTVLAGERGGRYPQGNALHVAGRDGAVVIDPSLTVGARANVPGVDAVVLSHCHEDHLAGLHRFPAVPCHVHELDRPGLGSLDGMMAIYGMTPAIDAAFRRVVVDEFHYTPRPDAIGFGDGAGWDLGGVRVRAIHAPGHTRGHCVFSIEPDGVLYLGDIDLSSFGPYYGDAWSSLADFERTLARVRELEARWYATFHHIGVLEGRAAFLERLDRFAGVICTREARLLDFLAEPRSLDDIVRHRFVYRPGDPVAFADDVERRSMLQHIERLIAAGRVGEIEPGRFRAKG